MTYVLNLSDTNSLATIMAQIDADLPQTSVGSPSGQNAAARSGIWCTDTNTGTMYVSTAGNGTIGGTSWAQSIVTAATATTSQAGIVELALPTDVQTGTDNTKAITSYALANGHYARSGANNDITQLNAFIGPLTPQQMFSVSSNSAIFNLLVTAAAGTPLAGYYLGSPDGSTYQWLSPTGLTVILAQSNNFSMTNNSYSLFLSNNINGNLPTSPTVGQRCWFAVGNSVTGCSISTTDGKLILGQSSPLNLNVTAQKGLIYTGSTNGWWLF